MRRFGPTMVIVMAAVLGRFALAAQAPAYTPPQEKVLALRAAQVDGLNRLADLVLESPLSAEKTVGQALGRSGEGAIALRRFLRSARVIGEGRFYSDGVAEVDLEVPLEPLVHEIQRLLPPAGEAAPTFDDLQRRSVDGHLEVSGRGRAPAEEMAPEMTKQVESSSLDVLPEMFPLGWESVTADGRVEAIRAARIRAYQAMADQIRAIELGAGRTIGQEVAGSSAAEVRLDLFIRGLPVAGPARLMPDRIAEVDVAAMVRDLIGILKEIRPAGQADDLWSEDRIDRLSVRLKTDRLTVMGFGMPPPEELRPGRTTVAVGAPMPDWAAGVLEARGIDDFSEGDTDTRDSEEVRLLAARAAKARASMDLERQLDAVRLDDGRTVRDRAAKDDVFRGDLKTFLGSARTVVSRPTEDGNGWEVILQLPLFRLYEFSRPR